MAKQFLRRASLIVADDANGIDLSGLRIVFATRQWSRTTPNTANIRVYNVSRETVEKVQGEFTRVVLQVGYEDGAFGAIFDGTIVQVKDGREDAASTYLDLIASDGDAGYNFSLVGFALAAGSTPLQQRAALLNAMVEHGITVGYVPDEFGDRALPRGKVFHGMARDFLDQLAEQTNTTWTIQNGQLDFVPVTSYKPGDAVVVNAETGMIGLPEQTAGGIVVRTLINPEYRVNGRIQLNNKSIQQQTINTDIDGVKSNAFLPNPDADGFYRIIMIENEGDTRGNEWYSTLTCIGLDQTVTPALRAKGYS